MHRRPALRPRARRPTTAVVGAAIVLLAACSSSTTSSTTGPPTSGGSTTTISASGWAGVDKGPSGTPDLDALLARLGQVERGPIDDTSCAGAPYVRDELLVYVSPVSRASKVTPDQILATLRPALQSAFKEQQVDGTVGRQLVPLDGAGGPVLALKVTGITIGVAAAANKALAAVFPSSGDAKSGGPAVSADVNHIGPFLPIGTFHPGDEPKEATKPEDAVTSSKGAHDVLVIDSPAPNDASVLPRAVTVAPLSPTAPYDAEGEQWSVANAGPDRKVDFVAGHGPFVADIVQRTAPASAVTLSAVLHDPAVPGWPQFLFTESDLIAAIERGLASDAMTTADGHTTSSQFSTPRRFHRHADLINFSLGLFGCDSDTHPVLAGELADVVDPTNYTGDLATRPAPLIVAAAGNESSTRAHYPAAFAGTGGALGSHTIAVGALADTSPAARACYSNHGPWVQAWAPGTATAMFPPAWSGATGLATWSGTSFATARVTGLLADQPGDPLATWTAALSGGSRLPGSSTALASSTEPAVATGC